MTPPAGNHTTGTLRRGAAPRAPRRKSGPARPLSAGAGPGAAVLAPPLALRLGRRAVRMGDARLLDRLVRGRVWIAIIAVGLLGIVFMQVSMLRLNAGVGRAVTTRDTLERQNAALRGALSELGSGQSIVDAASGSGMVMPAAGEIRYADARHASGRAAARALRPPAPAPAPVFAPAPEIEAPVADAAPAQGAQVAPAPPAVQAGAASPDEPAATVAPAAAQAQQQQQQQAPAAAAPSATTTAAGAVGATAAPQG